MYRVRRPGQARPSKTVVNVEIRAYFSRGPGSTLILVEFNPIHEEQRAELFWSNWNSKKLSFLDKSIEGSSLVRSWTNLIKNGGRSMHEGGRERERERAMYR